MQQPVLTIQKPESGARPAFTLTELMIVMAIIAILAGLGFSAYSGAIQLSRQQRTGAMINKIDQLIAERWENYRTRAVPVKIPPGAPPRVAAMIRLNAIRDLMRMELPDRKSDVIDPPCDCCPSYYDNQYATTVDPVISIAPITSTSFLPSLRASYIRRAMRLTSTTTLAALDSAWTPQYQASECLYLILSTIRDGDKSALDYFDSTEIGDTDADLMPEILDGWGTPMEFVRWPAGYGEQRGPDGNWGVAGVDDDGLNGLDDVGENNWQGSDDNLPNSTTLVGPVATTQTKNYFRSPDPFDPLKVHAGTTGTLFGTSYTPGFALYPLIVSAGPNKIIDIVTDSPSSLYHYSPSGSADNYPNPYVTVSVPLGTLQTNTTVSLGTPADTNFDGQAGYTDNISNHSLRSQNE